MTKPIALTIADAVDASGISRSELYLAMREGKLSAKKSGRRTLIMLADLEAYLNSLPVYRPGPVTHLAR